MENTWDNFLQEMRECDMVEDVDDPNDNLYELEEVLEKIESLTRKAQKLTKKIRIKNRKN